LALSVAYVLGLVLEVASTQWAYLLLLANSGTAVLDWSGYWTLSHRITWRRLGAWAKFGLLLVWVLLAPGFVLWDGLRSAWPARQRELAARPAHISELERDLAM
jgi:hypothetical protein